MPFFEESSDGWRKVKASGWTLLVRVRSVLWVVFSALMLLAEWHEGVLASRKPVQRICKGSLLEQVEEENWVGTDLYVSLYMYMYTLHITYTYNLLLWNIPTNLQARYDLFCVKSAVKPQPTNQPTEWELADSGSPGKWPLKWSWWLLDCVEIKMQWKIIEVWLEVNIFTFSQDHVTWVAVGMCITSCL